MRRQSHLEPAVLPEAEFVLAQAIAALRLWEEGCHDIHRPLEGRPFTTLQLLQNRADVPDSSGADNHPGRCLLP